MSVMRGKESLLLHSNVYNMWISEHTLYSYTWIRHKGDKDLLEACWDHLKWPWLKERGSTPVESTLDSWSRRWRVGLMTLCSKFGFISLFLCFLNCFSPVSSLSSQEAWQLICQLADVPSMTVKCHPAAFSRCPICSSISFMLTQLALNMC